jgi:ferrous iron transport protein A
MSHGATLLPLSEATIGKRFRLVEIHGGHRLTRRLLALGLSLGTELEVVQRRGRGVVVARGGNRVALGEGVAQKLMGEALG